VIDFTVSAHPFQANGSDFINHVELTLGSAITHKQAYEREHIIKSADL
jgi:hypothetical protein